MQSSCRRAGRPDPPPSTYGQVAGLLEVLVSGVARELFPTWACGKKTTKPVPLWQKDHNKSGAVREPPLIQDAVKKDDFRCHSERSETSRFFASLRMTILLFDRKPGYEESIRQSYAGDRSPWRILPSPPMGERVGVRGKLISGCPSTTCLTPAPPAGTAARPTT